MHRNYVVVSGAIFGLVARTHVTCETRWLRQACGSLTSLGSLGSHARSGDLGPTHGLVADVRGEVVVVVGHD